MIALAPKMVFRPYPRVCAAATMLLIGVLLTGCRAQRWGPIPVSPSLEDVTPDGSLYTPATQSFLRGKHWLETVEAVEIVIEGRQRARIMFQSPVEGHTLDVVNFPLDYLAPRLNYPAANPPDAFDAFNLMMAEYARNSVSVPVGEPGDAIAHFETSLPEAVPWTLVGNYRFEANPFVRPIRVGVVNNCLAPGLWEFNALDRSGELYHAWINVPGTFYQELVARVNAVPEAFVVHATAWHTDPVAIDLSRLRRLDEALGRSSFTLSDDAEVGYSSQDSRRKLAKRYALVGKGEALVKPQRRSDLTTSAVYLSDFVEPGKYDFTKRRKFDLAFLAEANYAEVRRVSPRTDYSWLDRPDAGAAPDRASAYLELSLHFKEVSIVLGNLPMALLVPQEDFVVQGFGVGVLSSDGLAERRAYLIEEGPAPSFAYLYQMAGGQPMALNAHAFGLEQVFIRTHIDDDEPWWEITITSFERIVDLVKYRVPIPETLHRDLTRYAMEYISPLYRTYRDDNLR